MVAGGEAGSLGFTVKILEEPCGGNLCSELRFGRKLSIIRGIVEQEIQAMVSRRENAATHHLYQAWDPVPSLAPATTGSRGLVGMLGRAGVSACTLRP